MKKVLVCALAALFLMATCLTAFAVDYTTTTTYNTNGALEIQTRVEGTTSGDMYTYLAHKDTDGTIDDDDIIYIDQKTSDGTPLTFSFTSSEADTIAKLAGVTVKSGSSVSDSANDQSDELVAAKRTVTVTVDYPDTEDVTDTVYFVEEYAEGGATTVEKTNIVIADGYSWDAATLDANIEINESNREVSVKDSADLDTETITITVTKDVVIPVPTIDTSVTKGGRYVGYTGDNLAEKLTVFGKIANIPTDKEFGIILSEDPNGYETSTRKYPAKFKDDEGRFAVQLINYIGENGENAELMNDWYAWIYVVDAEDNPIYSAVDANTFIDAE